ncbi:MAG: gluconate 2-dehydrogenase subunit 3 family protein [Flavihumibacter sp.]
MNRRVVLKQMIWMGAAVAFMPSCVYKQDKVSIQLKHLQINPDQEKMLALLADEVIPKTGTPGAADLGLHLFALKMADDCFNEENRQQFAGSLKAFTEAKAKNGSLTLQQAADDAALKDFANAYKSLIVRGYTQSEYYMTKVVP